MKFLSSASALLCLAPLAATATPTSLFGYSQDVIADGKAVQGDNPLEYCSESEPSGDILQIESVDLAPNPPKPGTTLVINAKGNLHQKIEKGAYVVLEVKYGLITLLRQTADLCEQLVNVDLQCPLEEGEMVLTKQVDLPKQIPSVCIIIFPDAEEPLSNLARVKQQGRYTVHADVYTKDNNRITCLDAKNIQF
ncbi:ML domain-containing protein [Aspergillus mulundensis]|uniref:Phosphatidylglycerol/phosphatidylinositol transfer protein n=1 Tax=Aspergillus mulundensis TaxID=1810919 RepID=A0A3D8SYH2_9EURO|nr:Phosphatidylglycerol transfer protein [Aspergillus mulundensis]RDW90818.1 Phosphatidylglycerol transfer protein [Aspergillus mulundensis]